MQQGKFIKKQIHQENSKVWFEQLLSDATAPGL